jgi:hypothetical protein
MRDHDVPAANPQIVIPYVVTGKASGGADPGCDERPMRERKDERDDADRSTSDKEP